MSDVLRIAIQKKGRLSEKSLAIISQCGIKFGSDERVLKEQATNFPLEFLYVRDDDIPAFVHDGVYKIGGPDKAGGGRKVARQPKHAGALTKF